jgi:hypothetical protein
MRTAKTADPKGERDFDPPDFNAHESIAGGGALMRWPAKLAALWSTGGVALLN